jgi:hypothetical protein
LFKLPDIVLELFVNDVAIANYNNGVKNPLVVGVKQVLELMGKPSNGVTFAATSTVLNQVALSCTFS